MTEWRYEFYCGACPEWRDESECDAHELGDGSVALVCRACGDTLAVARPSEDDPKRAGGGDEA